MEILFRDSDFCTARGKHENPTMRKLLAGAVILLLAACGSADEQLFVAKRVAHAGGGIDGKKYTNSYDALDLNIKNGFTYFEIDFSFTRDNRLVCIHDWDHSFRRSFGFDIQKKPTLKEFQDLVLHASEFRKCTLDGLAVWMEKNPSAILVTDVKENNLKALRLIAEKIQDAHKRVIPQIYKPQNFKIVRSMGYESIIWTLYRFRGDNNDVLAWVDRFSGPFAVTMPLTRARTGLPEQLAEQGIPTYVHTINKKGRMNVFFNLYHVTEIYTDFLYPVSAQ